MKKVMVHEIKIVAGVWTTLEKGEAVFHQWGVDYEELEGGPGNFSAAIVEYADGSVDVVRADRIKFLAV